MNMRNYSKIITLCFLLVAAVVSYQFKSSSRPDWKKISPFTEVQFEGEKIIAEYEGTFYEVASIEGISSAGLIEASRKHYGDLWQKRIREDIAEVLVAAGAPESTTVGLELKELESGAIKTVANAEMTKENRRIIYNRS